MDRTNAVLDQPETTFVSFDKPLTPEAERTLKLLKQRYTDADGKPLREFETETLVTLRIPRVLRPTPVVLGRAS